MVHSSSLFARAFGRALCLIGCCGAPIVASAQMVWDGGGNDNNWSTAANWSSNVAPGNPSTDLIVFAGSTRTQPNVDVPWSVLGIAFDSGASSFTVGGSLLTVGFSGITNNSGNSQTINNNLVVNGSQNWSATNGNLTLGGAVTTNGILFSVGAGAERTIALNGTISGAGILAVAANNAGTVSIAGNNTYTGTTFLLAGTVNAGSNTAFGIGPINIAGGTLQASSARTLANPIVLAGNSAIGGSANITFSGNVDVGTTTRTLTVSNTGVTTFSGVMSGTGGLTKAGSGEVVIAGVNSLTGNFTLSGGNVTVNPGASLAAASAGLVVNSGTLFFNNASQTIASVSGSGGTVNLGTTHTLIVNQSANTIYSGSFAGPGTLVKLGSGTLTLGGTIAHTGGTIVNAGALQLGASNRFADTAPITLGGGALLLNGFSDNIGTLNLTASSGIDFGTLRSSNTNTLAFADSSGQPWGSNTLTITGYVTGSTTLRFGSNASGLTATQLADIRFADYPTYTAQIDSLGIVTPIPEPAITTALFGAAALLAARVYRRRSKAQALAPV